MEGENLGLGLMLGFIAFINTILISIGTGFLKGVFIGEVYAGVWLGFLVGAIVFVGTLKYISWKEKNNSKRQ